MRDPFCPCRSAQTQTFDVDLSGHASRVEGCVLILQRPPDFATEMTGFDVMIDALGKMRAGITNRLGCKLEVLG